MNEDKEQSADKDIILILLLFMALILSIAGLINVSSL